MSKLLDIVEKTPAGKFAEDDEHGIIKEGDVFNITWWSEDMGQEVVAILYAKQDMTEDYLNEEFERAPEESFLYWVLESDMVGRMDDIELETSDNRARIFNRGCS